MEVNNKETFLQIEYLQSLATSSYAPPPGDQVVGGDDAVSALMAALAKDTTAWQQSNEPQASLLPASRQRPVHYLNEWCGDEVYKFIGDHFDMDPFEKRGGELVDVVFGPAPSSRVNGREQQENTLGFSHSSFSKPITPWLDEYAQATSTGFFALEEVSSTEGGSSDDFQRSDRIDDEAEEPMLDQASNHKRKNSPFGDSYHNLELKAHRLELQTGWKDIIVSQPTLATATADYKGKGPMLPPEKISRKDPASRHLHCGAFPPITLNVLEASIGSKCTDEVPFASVKVDRHGAAQTCIALQGGTHHLQQSRSWFVYSAMTSIDLDGHTLKRILLSEPLTIPVLAAGVVLLRELECEAVLKKPGLPPRHYVHPQWATLASAGVIEGESSLQWFCAPSPPYNVRESTLVFTPIYLHGSFSCYAFDFDRAILYIMDPRMSSADEGCFRLHKCTVDKLLPEAMRCMHVVTGKPHLGSGQWTAYVMLTARRRCSSKNTGIVAYNCMRWFNGRNVCYKDRENEPKLVRRTLVYQLLHMKGKIIDTSWLPAAGATYRPSHVQPQRKESE
ncbi:hypothetical protein ACP70R_040245 [Stipagrostis hirtigluma subsp. patula]